MTEAKLDKQAEVYTRIVRAGPQVKKPGEIWASDENWWDGFWKKIGGRASEEDVLKKQEEEANKSPQQKRVEETAASMDDKTLMNYARGKGWRPGVKGTVGDEMVKKVVREELKRRGKEANF